MKTYTLIWFLVLGIGFQLIPHRIIQAQGYDSLYLNNINACVNASGILFFNFERGEAGFEVPKFSGKHTIFNSTLWIGGVDQSSNLHLAAARYGQGPVIGPAFTKFDFWTGPVMDSSAYSTVQDSVWNYIWNIKKTEIEYHKTHWNDAGYQPIHDILTWPGNGNVSLGQSAQLAPYFDRSNDGIYQPMDGDYPLIKGDQSLFFIFNDDRNFHAETEGARMRVEIHGMLYAFDIPGDSAFRNTIFLNYKIFNRSENNYTNSYIGIFTDLDIGYANDDYIGCDVERSMFYGYNGTAVDGSGQPGAYGENPPVQSVSFIGGPLKDADGIDNPRYDGYGNQLCNESVNGINFGDSIIDNERLGMSKFVYCNNSNAGVPNYMTDPLYAPDYYKFLQGIWKDDTQMIYGGNGHLSAGGYGPACSFMFPGESDTLNWGTGCVLPNGDINWTEITAGNNPSDRRGVGSTGPFTFQAGTAQELDLAFIFARDYGKQSNAVSMDKLRTFSDEVSQSFISNILPNGGSFSGLNRKTGHQQLPLKLFPNPASDLVHLQFDRIMNEPVNLRIYNETGLLLRTETHNPGGQSITLNIAGLPSGLYLILLETKAQSVTKKVSVIR